ncbi:MAG: 2-C-methyl-D-erythritol 4-phosphate cytidylyltransferase [Verrucomicrobiota bacterium]
MSVACCTAIIVAAGAGTRMGFDKLAAPLAGKPVLFHTVAAFLAAETIAELVIVGPPSRAGILAEIRSPKPIRFISGGASRAESTALGLAEVSPEFPFVAVHDGARPLIRPAEIDRVVLHALKTGASALARRVAETLKRSDAAGVSAGAVDRDNLWAMETPQVFSTGILAAACRAAAASGFLATDEVSAVEATGGHVHFLESLAPNPKITVPSDLVLAEALMNLSTP